MLRFSGLQLSVLFGQRYDLNLRCSRRIGQPFAIRSDAPRIQVPLVLRVQGLRLSCAVRARPENTLCRGRKQNVFPARMPNRGSIRLPGSCHRTRLLEAQVPDEDLASCESRYAWGLDISNLLSVRREMRDVIHARLRDQNLLLARGVKHLNRGPRFSVGFARSLIHERAVLVSRYVILSRSRSGHARQVTQNQHRVTVNLQPLEVERDCEQRPFVAVKQVSARDVTARGSLNQRFRRSIFHREDVDCGGFLVSEVFARCEEKRLAARQNLRNVARTRAGTTPFRDFHGFPATRRNSNQSGEDVAVFRPTRPRSCDAGQRNHGAALDRYFLRSAVTGEPDPLAIR